MNINVTWIFWALFCRQKETNVLTANVAAHFLHISLLVKVFGKPYSPIMIPRRSLTKNKSVLNYLWSIKINKVNVIWVNNKLLTSMPTSFYWKANHFVDGFVWKFQLYLWTLQINKHFKMCSTFAIMDLYYKLVQHPFFSYSVAFPLWCSTSHTTIKKRKNNSHWNSFSLSLLSVPFCLQYLFRLFCLRIKVQAVSFSRFKRYSGSKVWK